MTNAFNSHLPYQQLGKALSIQNALMRKLAPDCFTEKELVRALKALAFGLIYTKTVEFMPLKL